MSERFELTDPPEWCRALEIEKVDAGSIEYFSRLDDFGDPLHDFLFALFGDDDTYSDADAGRSFRLQWCEPHRVCGQPYLSLREVREP